MFDHLSIRSRAIWDGSIASFRYPILYPAVTPSRSPTAVVLWELVWCFSVDSSKDLNCRMLSQYPRIFRLKEIRLLPRSFVARYSQKYKHFVTIVHLVISFSIHLINASYDFQCLSASWFLTTITTEISRRLIWWTIMYQDWRSYRRTPRTGTAVKKNSKFLKYHRSEGSQIKHTRSTIKPSKMNLTFGPGVDRSALNSICALSVENN
jgi:hypothetical protein